MFIHNSDPIALRAEISELSQKLEDLASQTYRLTNKIAVADNRNKQTMPIMLVREVNRLMSLGVPEDDALEDAREALEMTREAAYYAWANAKSHKTGLNRYAKIYACKALKQYGFSRRQISQILKISTGTVDLYMKTEFVK